MKTPTVQEAALAVAQYIVTEFPGLFSWLSYEDELAAKLLEDPKVVCAIEYTIPRVMAAYSHNTGMQHFGRYGGPVKVVGSVVGEWTQGHTSLDRELGSW